MKYLIQKINDHSQWDNLVSKSLNNNIFLKSYYLMPLEEKVDFFIDLYCRNKSEPSSYVLITPSEKTVPVSFSSLPGIQIEKKNERLYEVIIYLANSQDEL